MTDMEQALTISGAIFGLMVLTQYGRRHYNLHKILMPILSVATFGYFYLKDMPTAGADWVVYAVGAGIGVVFGVVATAATGVERDRLGKVFTRCGVGFLATWLTAVGLRIAFVALADHNDAFRQHLGTFMFEHGIVEDAIAPFFVVMALAMVLVRVALLAVRVRRTEIVAVADDATLVAV